MPPLRLQATAALVTRVTALETTILELMNPEFNDSTNSMSCRFLVPASWLQQLASAEIYQLTVAQLPLPRAPAMKCV